MTLAHTTGSPLVHVVTAVTDADRRPIATCACGERLEGERVRLYACASVEDGLRLIGGVVFCANCAGVEKST